MFCSKCGQQLQDEAKFCTACGNQTAETSKKEVKVVLDPAEVVEYKTKGDSSTNLSGQGGTLGMILMIISIIFSLVSMFTIGVDAFIPITIGSTVLFVVGFLMRMFCS